MESLNKRMTECRYEGLSPAEVEERRQAYGTNVLTPPQRDPWWRLWLNKFDDPIIRILIIAAIVAIFSGIFNRHYIEGIGIIAAIFLATSLSFLNEHKAIKEFDLLSQVNNDVPVKVIRQGIFTSVAKRDLVVGDVVLLEAGEEIPADGTVLEAISLQADESRLSGESFASLKFAKNAMPSDYQHDTAYQPYQLLRGAFIVDGHGVMEVTGVGDASEIGKTARAAAEEFNESTPLNAQLEKLSEIIGVFGFGTAGLIYLALVIQGAASGHIRLDTSQWVFAMTVMSGALIALIRVWLPIVYNGFKLAGMTLEKPRWLVSGGLYRWVKVIGLGAALIVVAGLVGSLTGFFHGSLADWLPWQAGQQFLTYFMIAVTIIVTAVPEGLAMSVTLSLAYGMRKMTASHSLVRKMDACETIGAITVICTDKTGTLTKNEMTIAAAEFPSLRESKAPGDAVSSKSKALIYEAIACNSTANLGYLESEGMCALGNPTECALLWWLQEQHIDYGAYRSQFEIEYQWTFTTERKFMATLGTSQATGKRILHVKGAPEIVLARSASVLTREGVAPIAVHRSQIEQSLKTYQVRGMRTLGFAFDPSLKSYDGVDIVHAAEDLIWLGFVAIADPVRDDVMQAISDCRAAQIEVKIVTGDNEETATEIARQIGLVGNTPQENEHLSGKQFSELSDKDAARILPQLKILSRARPMDKLRLVELLKAGNQVVAVTGDGVNDAPALHHASVGLAMGKTGTDIAKEVSDIILLDDSFKTIVNAVMWGRSLYENIQRFILFQLTINVAALSIALLGPFIGVSLPLTVMQILWINLIMDTFAALALATEPPHHEVMARAPRDPRSFIVTRDMAKSIFSVAGVFLVILMSLLFWVKATPEDSPEHLYRLSIFFTIFVMMQWWNLFNARCLGQTYSAFHRIMQNKGFVIISTAIILGQVAIIQFGGQVFRTVPLTVTAWLVILASTSSVLWIGELLRHYYRSRTNQRQPERSKP